MNIVMFKVKPITRVGHTSNRFRWFVWPIQISPIWIYLSSEEISKFLGGPAVLGVSWYFILSHFTSVIGPILSAEGTACWYASFLLIMFTFSFINLISLITIISFQLDAKPTAQDHFSLRTAGASIHIVIHCKVILSYHS